MKEGRKEEKPGQVFCLIIVCISILAAGVAGVAFGGGADAYKSGAEKREEIPDAQTAFPLEEALEYTIYVGLNDKDTYRQLLSTAQAKEIIDAICIQYVDGYTVTEAEGAWMDEKNVLTRENTLVYHFREADEEALREMMNRIMQALNQNTILMEVRTASGIYYGGEGARKEGEADDKDGK